jgi:heme/copper-type cytochrome/quinol oxidase subunit 3
MRPLRRPGSGIFLGGAERRFAVEAINVAEYMSVLGWRFDPAQWIGQRGLRPDQVPHVKLFLLLYWIMTGFHALHVTIGIATVLVMLVLARQSW